jgi:hypothetical protein
VTLSSSIHEWAAFAADLHHAGLLDRALRDRLTLGWNHAEIGTSRIGSISQLLVDLARSGGGVNIQVPG